jgi:hypothetical protein
MRAEADPPVRRPIFTAEQLKRIERTTLPDWSRSTETKDIPQ